MAGVAYYILTLNIIRTHGQDSVLAKAIGRDRKGTVSVLFYLLAIVFALPYPMVSCAIFVIVAIMWLIPDKRIEEVIKSSH